jgi:hypothetical protein
MEDAALRSLEMTRLVEVRRQSGRGLYLTLLDVKPDGGARVEDCPPERRPSSRAG